jgi:hypothetical protein
VVPPLLPLLLPPRQYEELAQTRCPLSSGAQHPLEHWLFDEHVVMQPWFVTHVVPDGQPFGQPPLPPLLLVPLLPLLPLLLPPEVTHLPAEQYAPLPQLPHEPPQPSSPHCLPEQFGTQSAHVQSRAQPSLHTASPPSSVHDFFT